tara:strand:- start:224 stop:682 length:459 start_codon:yes stop_codon:yes gene_type:complete
LKSQEWLKSQRTVRFGETDPAGVIHFHQLLRWCHEAWEESLERYGLNLSDIFPGPSDTKKTIPIFLPIVHCEADFRLPIYTGDFLTLRLMPQRIDSCSFNLQIKFYRDSTFVAQGLLRHIAVDSTTRRRTQLPEKIDLWLEASLLFQGVAPT